MSLLVIGAIGAAATYYFGSTKKTAKMSNTAANKNRSKKAKQSDESSRSEEEELEEEEALMERDKSKTYIAGFHMSTGLMVCCLLFGVIGGVGFNIIPWLFILGVTRFQPIYWMIGYSIFFGVDFVYFTVCLVKLHYVTKEKNGQHLLKNYLGPSSTPGTYKRFWAYYIIKTFTVVMFLISWWLWLFSSTSSDGVPYSNAMDAPFAPEKTAFGYFSFQQICIVQVFYYFVSLVYCIQLFNDLYGSSRERPRGEVENTGLNVVDISTKEDKKIRLRMGVKAVYYVGVGLLYVPAVVEILIMFVQTFDVHTSMQLYVVMSMNAIKTFGYVLIVVGYYGWPNGQSFNAAIYTRSLVSGDVRELGYALFFGHLLWAINIFFNWVCYIYYWGQIGSDHVDFHSYPMFNRNPNQPGPTYSQTNGWYVWQMQTEINSAFLPLLVIMLIPVCYASGSIIKDTNAVYRKAIKLMDTHKIKESRATAIFIAIVFVFFLAVMVIFVFDMTALVGNPWLITVFLNYVVAFTVIGVVFVIIFIIISHYRIDANSPSDGSMESNVRRLINETWTISTWQIIIAMPVALAQMIVIYWYAFYKYETEFRQPNAWALISQPQGTPTNTLPLNAFTYYWWNIPTSVVLLVMSFIVLLIEVISTLSSKRISQVTNNKPVDNPKRSVRKSTNE